MIVSSLETSPVFAGCVYSSMPSPRAGVGLGRRRDTASSDTSYQSTSFAKSKRSWRWLRTANGETRCRWFRQEVKVFAALVLLLMNSWASSSALQPSLHSAILALLTSCIGGVPQNHVFEKGTGRPWAVAAETQPNAGDASASDTSSLSPALPRRLDAARSAASESAVYDSPSRAEESHRPTQQWGRSVSGDLQSAPSISRSEADAASKGDPAVRGQDVGHVTRQNDVEMLPPQGRLHVDVLKVANSPENSYQRSVSDSTVSEDESAGGSIESESLSGGWPIGFSAKSTAVLPESTKNNGLGVGDGMSWSGAVEDQNAPSNPSARSSHHNWRDSTVDRAFAIESNGAKTLSGRPEAHSHYTHSVGRPLRGGVDSPRRWDSKETFRALLLKTKGRGLKIRLLFPTLGLRNHSSHYGGDAKGAELHDGGNRKGGDESPPGVEWFDVGEADAGRILSGTTGTPPRELHGFSSTLHHPHFLYSGSSGIYLYRFRYEVSFVSLDEIAAHMRKFGIVFHESRLWEAGFEIEKELGGINRSAYPDQYFVLVPDERVKHFPPVGGKRRHFDKNRTSTSEVRLLEPERIAQAVFKVWNAKLPGTWQLLQDAPPCVIFRRDLASVATGVTSGGDSGKVNTMADSLGTSAANSEGARQPLSSGATSRAANRQSSANAQEPQLRFLPQDAFSILEKLVDPEASIESKKPRETIWSRVMSKRFSSSRSSVNWRHVFDKLMIFALPGEGEDPGFFDRYKNHDWIHLDATVKSSSSSETSEDKEDASHLAELNELRRAVENLPPERRRLRRGETWGVLSFLFLFGIPDAGGSLGFPFGWPRNIDKSVTSLQNGLAASGCTLCPALTGFLLSMGFPPLVSATHASAIPMATKSLSPFLLLSGTVADAVSPLESSVLDPPRERRGFDMPLIAYARGKASGDLFAKLAYWNYIRHGLGSPSLVYARLQASSQQSTHRPMTNSTESCMYGLETLLDVASESLATSKQRPNSSWGILRQRARHDHETRGYAQFIQEAANEGSPEGLAAMGELHYSGHAAGGIPQDVTRAAEMWGAAAARGHGVAALARAYLHLDGDFGARDEAEPYLRQAMGNGPAPTRYFAEHFIHRMGLGVPKNETRAGELLMLAAEHGDSNAQLLLGHAYASGDIGVYPPGGPSDMESLKWYKKASDTSLVASYNVGIMTLQGADKVYRQMTERCNVADSHLRKVVASHSRILLLSRMASRAFSSGDSTGALLLSMFLSELGDEMGHINAADLWKDRQLRHGMFLRMLSRVHGQSHHQEISLSENGDQDSETESPDFALTEDELRRLQEVLSSSKERSSRAQENYVPRRQESYLAAKSVNSLSVDDWEHLRVSEFLHCWARPELYYTQHGHVLEALGSAAQAEGIQRPATFLGSPGVCGFYFSKRAAFQASFPDVFEVAKTYSIGTDGVELDLRRAYEWIRFAADRGNERGFYERAVCLEHGLGIPANKTMAYELYGKLVFEGKDPASSAASLLRLCRSTLEWLFWKFVDIVAGIAGGICHFLAKPVPVSSEGGDENFANQRLLMVADLIGAGGFIRGASSFFKSDASFPLAAFARPAVIGKESSLWTELIFHHCWNVTWIWLCGVIGFLLFCARATIAVERREYELVEGGRYIRADDDFRLGHRN